MRFRFNPEPWPVVANSTRMNAPTSTTMEIAILAAGAAIGGTAGALVGRSRSAAGVGAGLGIGIAIALVVTAQGDG